jgi:uncharacterized protein (TIGR02391 family)
MAGKKPPEPVPKRFATVAEATAGIVKLRRRIDALQKFIDGKVHQENPLVRAEEHTIQGIIGTVYGVDSLEYDIHKYFKVDRVPPHATANLLGSRWGGGGFPHPQQQTAQAGSEALSGYAAAIVELQVLERGIEEQRMDLAGPDGVVASTVWHSRIAAAALGLYQGEHYRQAVTDGFLALRDMVREKSGRTDLDGVPLMTTVFAVKDGVLRMSADPAEQQGAMFLYAGAAGWMRNPRAHSLDQDTADVARECLGMLSYLARELDAMKP